MARRTLSHLSLIPLLALLLCSGSRGLHQEEKRLKQRVSISTKQKDITTPLTTIPLTNPSTPSTMNPMLNPTVDSGQDSPSITNTDTPTTTHAPGSSSGSWCVASKSATQITLQSALDYACGHGGADCSAIQPGGSCFSPITVRDHASYAFNSYYQKNPIPTSCNFGGSAVTTSTNPSYGACQYPTISTTSSLLNTTNSIGSRVFGAGPVTPSTPPAAAMTRSISSFHFILLLLSHCMLMIVRMEICRD